MPPDMLEQLAEQHRRGSATSAMDKSLSGTKLRESHDLMVMPSSSGHKWGDTA